MPLLTVPNWSLGRERSVLREAFDYLTAQPVTVHYAEADIDHNRTVTAFSGTPENVREALLGLAAIFLPCIDLQRHSGVHPRIGGLDVCPFVPLPPLRSPGDENFSQDPPGHDAGNAGDLNRYIASVAQTLAETFQIPIFLYEHSAPGRDLPNLRKGGFGSLLDRTLSPDFGPNRAHPHLGATVLGWRDFLVALNVNFPDAPGAVETMRLIASQIRDKRRNGDPLFQGVRALGLSLQAQGLCQLSMNITKPDAADFDSIVAFIEEKAAKHGIGDGYTQLIGVIRDTDVERSVKIFPRVEQIVPTRQATHWSEDWQ
ncbi:MAG: hypothetical protein JNM28_01435 [Armatimonadetes bacterium]|nr:hypothetical protein [Armatimonadota bacterium]MBS1711030.1 hypothetical protein [Armatimonadota bacterium]MBX3108702.1 hypothetical protein [Fimbriimonadaceae bacterium]